MDKILDMLMKLNGMVTLGLISTSKANAIHRNLKIILDTQMKRAQGEQLGIPTEALADLCRKDPVILNLIEPFLTEDQIDWILGEVKEDQNEQV